jgi:hypothetical protein
MTEDITKVHKEAILSTGLYTDFVESIPVSRILRLILGPRLIMTPLHPDLVRDRERPLYYRLGVRVENRPDPSHWLKGVGFQIGWSEKGCFFQNRQDS